MTSFIGRTINSRYRLESLLGDGGMGSVYRAHDINLDRQVAIKLMHAHFARQPEFRARLIQARTAASLDHPSVVRIFDFGDSDAGLFIAMEFVNGGSLRDHLRRLQSMQKYLPLEQSLQIVMQIAEALDYAHRKGIVHRDVKPGNIILKRLNQPDEPGAQPFRAVLTDFGLVKLHEGMPMTESGATLGTPTYMSPEQCEGRTLDGRTDLYSLGVVLYELVTNKLPFKVQTLSEAIYTHKLGEMPPPARNWREDVPPIVDSILLQTLAKDPDGRFETGADMVTALKSTSIALGGAPTRVMSRDEVDILERINEPPPGYDLHIATPGHDVSVVPLSQAVVTLGRNADNTVVLPAEGVSRHHARLQATALGWEVIDLGGINGTWLDAHRLRADDPTPFPPGATLNIGPYELTLHAPEVVGFPPETELPSPSGQITPGLDRGPETVVAAERKEETAVAPLAIFLPRESISVDPGEQANIHVEVVNRGTIDDRVSLRLQGLPPSWVISPGKFESVPAGKTAQLTLSIRPPRQSNTPTGRQRFRIEVVSQQQPRLRIAASGSLMLGGFVAFDAALDKKQVRLPGLVIASIQNTGNTAGEFSLVGRDRQNVVKFRGERGRIQLEPGQTAHVELELESRRQTWFGRTEIFPFDIELMSRAGGRQTLSGQARSSAAIPAFVLYGLLFFITFACALSGIIFITSRMNLFAGGNENTATPTGITTTTIAIPLESVTPLSPATATPTVTPSGSTTPVAPENDRDNDGLSDGQEAILTTDPDNPDTDNDGLTDGAEVLTYGTEPKNRDTDNDLLFDGDEVNVYLTNPREADTDGDGIDDVVEIRQGSNPLVSDSTPTVTAVPSLTVTPTLTPTQGPSPTPSQTPTPSPTPTVTNTPPPSATTTPTATATDTATPTATHTATPIPTDTETPAPTPTSTPTATPTNTPMPVPLLTCIQTPPTIDGSFLVSEWPDTPLFEFQPANQTDRLVQVYFARDVENLYLAFLINDPSNEAADSLRVYFDVTNNGGDPDANDRFIQVGRNQSAVIFSGIGSNSDGNNWDSNFNSNNWSAVAGESGGAQWIVEMTINAAADMGALANPFGGMVQVVYTGLLTAWPENAASSDANTWQDIDNISCN